MVRVIELVAYVALWSSVSAAQHDDPKACPCYTATTWVDDKQCPPFKPTSVCSRQPCARLVETTVPGFNKKCPTTPTTTLFLPCQTACPKGCETYTNTVTDSTACPPIAPTLPPPPTLVTSLKPPKSTITSPPQPPRSRPCFTKTVSATKVCPEDQLGCPPPDCIWLSTTLVPPGPVEGCEKTPTVTRSRTCSGRCNGDCATQWITETATAW